MFRFEHPLFLLLLVLVPVFFIYEKKRRRVKVEYSSLSLPGDLAHAATPAVFWFPFLVRVFAFSLLIFALAKPERADLRTEVSSEGVDILLTIDTSGSMQALDFKIGGREVDRLTAVKQVVADFIKNRQSDRIGMVIFGEMAYTQVPLTLDYDVLLSFLDQVEIGAAGDATAIGDGLALSVKRLKDLPTKSKIIILLTDGRNNAGSITPEKAAELAATYGIKVYTIGVGSRGPVPFPEQTLFGMRHIMVQLDIDEETLQKIAQQTGGQYFRATDTEGLKKIYATIDKLEKSEAKVKNFQEYHQLYPYFLWPALALLFLEFLLREFVVRRLV